MKILVTGKDGQLGKSLQAVVANNKDYEFVFSSRRELDLSSADSIRLYFQNNEFDVIVNCAAYTAVDRAESESIIANQINHLAVEELAKVANRQGADLIHISTDYVFDGDSNKLYVEDDLTNPINTYGHTKLKGEKSIQKYMTHNAVIIRTSWVYSEYENNFLHTVLRLCKDRDSLSIVSDQRGCPTYAGDLARVIFFIVQHRKLIRGRPSQIYHYSNEGSCSWYEFAKEILNLFGMDGKCEILPIETWQYPTDAKRPKDATMSKHKIRDVFGIDIPSWEKSLAFCVKNIQNFNLQ